jgi:hypothetical protein
MRKRNNTHLVCMEHARTPVILSYVLLHLRIPVLAAVCFAEIMVGFAVLPMAKSQPGKIFKLASTVYRY